jgi:cytochrome c-type biogenesis protein
VSPCVLPLVPGYISMVSGLSAAELESGGDGATPAGALRPVLRGIGLFVAGFTVVFVALGAAASSIGRVLDAHQLVLGKVSGAVIILLGAVLLVGALPARLWTHAGSGTLGLVSRVTGEHRFDVRPSKLGSWAAPVMGMAFAFAWTPCIGPVLGAVLGLAARSGTLSGGVVLLFAYSLGLAVPFVLVGLAFGRLTAALARARSWLWIVEISNLLNDLGLGRLSRS